MSDSAWTDVQKLHLHALGVDVLRLRAASLPSPEVHVAIPEIRQVHLRQHDGALPDLSHPRVLAVLRAIGLQSNQIATGEGAAFDLMLPTPDELREGGIKRALWPALRRLRRHLRDAGGDE